jgi:hypothetical protein
MTGFSENHENFLSVPHVIYYSCCHLLRWTNLRWFSASFFLGAGLVLKFEKCGDRAKANRGSWEKNAE